MAEFNGIDIVDTVYEGANTHVFRGIIRDENQPVILKTTSSPNPSPQEVARYSHEYNVLKSFKSLGLKSVVNVIDLIMYEHRPYLVLEDSGSADLKTLHNSEPFEIAQIVDIAVKTASALGEIYQAQIIHKDIKPSNILYNPETGVLKLMDFSSASIISRETPTVETAMLMTATLPYMSPEQTGRMNRLVDWRTDFYSFGVTLYELFTGRLPFLSTEPIELVHAHLALNPESPHKINAAIPPVLSDIILKLMAKDAEDRYQGAFGIQHDLRQCLDRFDESGKIEPFEIGQKDISDRLRIPQKLYGREAEINTLLAGFDEVSRAPAKWFW